MVLKPFLHLLENLFLSEVLALIRLCLIMASLNRPHRVKQASILEGKIWLPETTVWSAALVAGGKWDPRKDPIS